MATILVVDDRPSNREYLLTLLGFTGHRVLEAHDGAQALELVRAQRPDLIITDILMPTMDGYEFVQRLRADPALAATRVIFYSAIFAERETLEMAASCGVRTVLGKPSDPQAIFDAVNAELGLSAPAQILPPPAPPTTPTPAPGAAGVPGDGIGERLAALEQMCLRLIGERRPQALVEVFLQAASHILGADYLALCLLESDETHVRHLAAHGFDPQLLAPHALDRARLPGALLAARAPLRLAGSDPQLAFLPAGHPPPGAFLGLPVRDPQQLHGWMYCVRQPGAAPFTVDDERIGATLGAQLAVAYENLNLYQVVQRHAAQLQLEATARAQADAALRESEHRLVLARQVFDSTAEGIMMTDRDANIVAVNPAFEQITGYREHEVLGRNPRLLRSGRHDHAFFREMWASLAAHGQWRGEIWNRRNSGEVYPEHMSISAVRGTAGQVSAYVSVSSDISALKAAHHQLDFLANHDALTRLPNRSLLLDRLQQAIAAARQDGRQLGVLLFNVDRLARINESLGHAAGDTLLREIARRAHAIAGPTDTVARLPGDEFVLLRTNCQDTDDIIVCARRLIDTIAQPLPVDGHDVVVTASVGISIFPRDGATPGELLKGADVALSHMKEGGRNGFRFFKGEMNAHALRWLSVETHLRRAIARGELALHYQPQVSCATQRIAGMEALLRWHSPELGDIAPVDFIPLAEDTGLIQQIGAWVIREACRQNKAWHDAGLARVPVAVNVSAHQFATGALPGVVRAALADTGMEPRWLDIEVTESAVMGDVAAAQDQLAELRALGVLVSLDDFGTGYSSLGYLSRFSLDKLKIDRGFVRDIITEPRSAAIARATIALAHGLSLGVVAEGVETLAQRDCLRNMGCELLQGYLYSRPLPAAQMALLLGAGRIEV
jgi:diguanylate cyclase (GGDEF)-like protein/PAS domain S-box-containing protein